jgi:hypothetical protein
MRRVIRKTGGRYSAHPGELMNRLFGDMRDRRETGWDPEKHAAIAKLQKRGGRARFI